MTFNPYPKSASIGHKKLKLPKEKKRTTTGERQMFIRKWNMSKHECEWCGIKITEPVYANFSHKVAKSIDENKRLDLSNLNLYCVDCHDAYGNRGSVKFQARKDINHN